MARPKKKGLSYFPKDVDFYDDFKIMTLLDEYGPLGVTIYEVILTFVYRGDGYYLAAPSLDQLATQIVRKIGSRWIPRKNLVLQVIHRCVDLGLFNKDLLTKGVITSAGIQKRYAEVTVRNKVDKSLYWLLDGKQPGDRIPSFGVNVAETQVNVTETQVNVTETTTNQIKENKSKVNQIKSTPKAKSNPLPPDESDDDETMIEELILHRNCTKSEMAEISEIKAQYSGEDIRRAISKTSERGGRSLAYLRKVLESSARESNERMPSTYDVSELEQIYWDDLLGDDDDV